MACVCTLLGDVILSGIALYGALIAIIFLISACLLFASGSISSRHSYCGKSYVRSRNFCICSSVWSIAFFVGMFASSWFLPWWLATRGGTIYNVDATATSWIASNTAPQYGVYHFSQLTSSGTAAFINQEKAGAFSSDGWFCVAPIVTSWNQTEVVFWATDTGCCSQSGVTCWLRFNSPGSAAISARVSPYLRNSEVFENARLASCKNLAINAAKSARDLCSLPAVYLDVASTKTAEDTLNYYLFCGLFFTCLFAGVWPCYVYLIASLKWGAEADDPLN